MLSNTEYMDDLTKARPQPVTVVIRFNTSDIYRLTLLEFVKFPRALLFLLPVAGVGFFEAKAGEGPSLSLALLVFLFGVLPAIHVFRIRKSPGVNSETQHGFSDSGISTVMGPVSNFAAWSFGKDAAEDARHLTVRSKNGAVIPPRGNWITTICALSARSSAPT